MVVSGAFWCRSTEYQPAVGIARRVKKLAKRERMSANRMIVSLIETGLEAREREKRAFFELAERLANSTNTAEQKRLKEELARMTFGE